ncbi:hypothetical protein ACJIZ3_023386 [Penstemon smallii]|uniref:Pentatricopeptide repeat-containing protein n=1 Tax=Penstemon smallii TaxID=265156 RepID=A0ABD3TRB2_9LAMI
MYHSLIMKLGWEHYDYVRNGLIHCFVSCKELVYARKVFDTSPERDFVTWTALINGYLKIGELELARELFDEMPNKNVVSWSAMINGYAKNGMFVEALEIFNDMLAVGTRPNHSTIVGALSACASLGALVQGRWLHAYVDRNNMEMDGILGTALIDMYAKCGCIKLSCLVFEKMSYRDTFVYTALISGLADHGMSKSALELFGRMVVEGIRPNEVTFLCVLSACSRIGLVEEGLRIFKSMKHVYQIEPGTKHYGCLVDLLSRAGLLEHAANVVANMLVEPDCYVFGALMNACRVYGNVDLGKVMADGFIERSLDHSGVHVLLSNIYASMNKWDDVEKVRKGMEERKVRKVTGYSLLEVDGRVLEFVAGDMFYIHMDEVMCLLLRMEIHLKSLEIDEDGLR